MDEWTNRKVQTHADIARLLDKLEIEMKRARGDLEAMRGRSSQASQGLAETLEAIFVQNVSELASSLVQVSEQLHVALIKLSRGGDN